MLVHRSIKFSGSHLYAWAERDTMSVLPKISAKVRTRTARSGVERIYHEATALTQCVLKIVTKWQKNQTKSVLVHTHLILTPTMLTVITKESTRTRTRVTSNARAAIPTGWKTSRCKRRKQKQLINTMARLTFV